MGKREVGELTLERERKGEEKHGRERKVGADRWGDEKGGEDRKLGGAREVWGRERWGRVN